MKTTEGAQTPTKDLLSLEMLTHVTEQKLFGFKCIVRDGSLAEREVERRIRTFFAVLADSRVVLARVTPAQKNIKDPSEVLPELLDAILPIYRKGERELSTENILSDVMDYFRIKNIVLEFTSSLKDKSPL